MKIVYITKIVWEGHKFTNWGYILKSNDVCAVYVFLTYTYTRAGWAEFKMSIL